MRKPKKHSGLTKRTLQVLSCIGEGYSTKDIATELRISEKTVDWQVVNLHTALNTNHNRVTLARIAIAFGLAAPICLLLMVGCAANPPAPSGPTALAKPQKTTSVTMAWNPVTGATNYLLLWGLSTSYNNIRATPLTQTRISGLSVGALYHFAVKCQDPRGTSDNSPDVAWKAVSWPGNSPAPIP